VPPAFRNLLLLLVAGLAGCQSTAPVLRYTGVGAVAFGGSLAETQVLLGESVAGQVTGAACQFVEFDALPGLRFMVEDGVITRADCGPGVRTELGVQVGDTMDSVVRLYPDVLVRNHDGALEGVYLLFPAGDGRHSIVMESIGNKIVSIRAGVEPSVGYVDGCR
jgi:hypothetical protein